MRVKGTWRENSASKKENNKREEKKGYGTQKNKPPPGFEPAIACLLDRRFNQLSHGWKHWQYYVKRRIRA